MLEMQMNCSSRCYSEQNLRAIANLMEAIKEFCTIRSFNLSVFCLILYRRCNEGKIENVSKVGKTIIWFLIDKSDDQFGF